MKEKFKELMPGLFGPEVPKGQLVSMVQLWTMSWAESLKSVGDVNGIEKILPTLAVIALGNADQIYEDWKWWQ